MNRRPVLRVRLSPLCSPAGCAPTWCCRTSAPARVWRFEARWRSQTQRALSRLAAITLLVCRWTQTHPHRSFPKTKWNLKQKNFSLLRVVTAGILASDSVADLCTGHYSSAPISSSQHFVQFATFLRLCLYRHVGESDARTFVIHGPMRMP